MNRLLGLLTNWSEKILSAAPERVQQQARQRADRLLRLVGGNPQATPATPLPPRRQESGQALNQGAAVEDAIKRGQ